MHLCGMQLITHPWPTAVQINFWVPLYKHGLTVIPTWTNNHLPGKIWDYIIYPFPNIKGSTFKFRHGKVISSHMVEVISYRCWDSSWFILVNEATGVKAMTKVYIAGTSEDTATYSCPKFVVLDLRCCCWIKMLKLIKYLGMTIYVSGGFPTIDRNHYHTQPYLKVGPGYPVVLMAPPPGSPAAITREATVRAYRLYIKAGGATPSVIFQYYQDAVISVI